MLRIVTDPSPAGFRLTRLRQQLQAEESTVCLQINLWLLIRSDFGSERKWTWRSWWTMDDERGTPVNFILNPTDSDTVFSLTIDLYWSAMSVESPPCVKCWSALWSGLKHVFVFLETFIVTVTSDWNLRTLTEVPLGGQLSTLWTYLFLLILLSHVKYSLAGNCRACIHSVRQHHVSTSSSFR